MDAAEAAGAGGEGDRDLAADLRRLTERDQLDRTRAASPLYAAADAIVVDTTGKSVEEVVNDVMQEVQRQTAKGQR